MLLKPSQINCIFDRIWITNEELGLMYPKPKELEQKKTLTPKQRRAKKFELCRKQKWRCAICNCIIVMDWGYYNSAELDHIKPEPMGCAKNDSDDNLQVLCRKCNSEKGSRR